MKPAVTAIKPREEVAVEKRRAIHPAIKLAVLQAQLLRYVTPYNSIPTRSVAEELAVAIKYAECASGCGERLYNGMHFDHILPLELGGRTSVDNLRVLCLACHKVKTRADVSRIAKARRQARKSGRQRADKKSRGKIKSRGFDSNMTKGFDGKVRTR